jgi:hypothetical protein
MRLSDEFTALLQKANDLRPSDCLRLAKFVVDHGDEFRAAIDLRAKLAAEVEAWRAMAERRPGDDPVWTQYVGSTYAACAFSLEAIVKGEPHAD